MAKLVNALDLKSSGLMALWVRVPPTPPINKGVKMSRLIINQLNNYEHEQKCESCILYQKETGSGNINLATYSITYDEHSECISPCELKDKGEDIINIEEWIIFFTCLDHLSEDIVDFF